MGTDTNNPFITERRSYERIQCEYSAIVHGSFRDGTKLEEIVKVLNLSASGAYFSINRQVEVGQVLSVKMVFPTGSLEYGSSKVAIKALVVRTELCSEGVLGIGTQFQNYRFL